MASAEREFHETWIGMAQPIEGQVVSIPVLLEAQCAERQATAVQETLRAQCPPAPSRRKGDEGPRSIADLPRFFEQLLDLSPDLFTAGEDLPPELSFISPETHQEIRPTLALRHDEDDATFLLLVWDLPVSLDLDKPETVTGPWHYPPAAKFDRLLRHCRVPIGLLTNRRVVRLVYAPHGEATGAITFPIDAMAETGGRPLLDAFVMLLSRHRLFGVIPERRLPAILEASRRRQAEVTQELARQVFEALEVLLRGFEAAADRDGRRWLDEAAAREGDHLYGGLLTVLLRLVFLLYAEDRSLLPAEEPLYAESFSVFGLFDELRRDHAAFPDTMGQRFGAWHRLIVLFRTVYEGASHGSFRMPARRGELFDPNAWPFLEGWNGGSAPHLTEDRAALHLPSIDDGTVHAVLERLIVLEGQRLSYRSLDVEQIGSVYEALMGYHVERQTAPAVCLGKAHAWVTARDLLDEPPARRARWLQERTGLAKGQAENILAAVGKAQDEEAALAVLSTFRVRGTERVSAGRFVLQPGEERRRTSSHYTPRSLTEPIVRRTLEPLLAVLGPEPPSHLLLALRVCDPAMGSGAFLVEACRFLADQLVAAWAREGLRNEIEAKYGDPLHYAKRVVAQTCLYGVDKNPFAVPLAKLSLWLETLARDLPFTFLDHALRCGDSLVGLSFEQIRGFHWKPTAQTDLASRLLDEALAKAVSLRREIQEHAEDRSPEAQHLKEKLLEDAQAATAKVRLLADLVVGAFFSSSKAGERSRELSSRWTKVLAWLDAGDAPVPAELRSFQESLHETVRPFHWMVEFPEVFFAERPDPLECGLVNRAAWMDAFVGNPPFAGKNAVADLGGESHLPWLKVIHEGAHGNADYSAHFFRRCAVLLGRHGTLGLMATNTIAQGDTRATGLQPLVAQGLTLYDATRSQLWPGEANVAFSVVHLAKGRAREGVGPLELDSKPVEVINSRLRGKPERPDPVPLAANADLSFQGSIVLGMGFTLTPAEREALIAGDPRNAERIFPYLGGEEVNTSPTQSFERYVINFGQMTLEEAEKWPGLIEIVREKVKPERDNLKDTADGVRLKKYWWQFCRDRPALAQATAGSHRSLVAARVTKHLCLSFQSPCQVFAETTFVFALATETGFACLQSRVHEVWARLLSSSMRNDLRYAASDCFETFPFPTDPRAEHPALEDIGKRLYEARAAFMLSTEQGLTDTYNLLKDPTCHDPRITELRSLHEEMDRVVLAAYGWADIPVPPYAGADPGSIEAFEDEVIDRLFLLNAKRAAEERQGAGGDNTKGKRKKKSAPADGAQLVLASGEPKE